MYSIVMMTALAAAPDAPQFNGYFRDLIRGGCSGSCNGCSGGVRYSCFGGGCSGASYAASCNGCSGCCGSSCCGGGVFGLGLGDRMRSWFEPSGCCGSHSYGCSGASYSCSGYSCSGSAYSCFGGPAMSYAPVYGGLSCQGGFPVSPIPVDTFPPYPGQPMSPYAVPAPAPGMALRADPPAVVAAAGQTGRASVVVKLPADAMLSADGRALNLTGTERKFVSPELPLGQVFVYKFTAEYERDGEAVSVSKKVSVQAGATVAVEFTDLTAAKPTAGPAKTTSAAPAAVTPAVTPAKSEPKAEPAKSEPPTAPADRATITVKLPPNATLYVDDRKSPSKEPVRQFATPPLPAGKEFAYMIKAEVVRDGQPETLTQKVPFRAGERITVDFTSLGGK